MSSTTPTVEERTPTGAGRRISGLRRRGATRSEGRLAFWLIIPTVVALAVVVGYPVVQAVYRSFFSDPIAGDPEFIGFENYTTPLWGFERTEFWSAFWATVFYTVTSVILEVIIGFAMALVMNRAFRGRGLIRTSVLVPWAIPTAVTAVLWGWMLEPNGIVNAITGADTIWTGSEWPAKWAMVFADTWKTAPFIALLILAGLQIIPTELYEAAKVDGADAWRRFTTITLPLVKPALLVAVLFRILDVLRIYDLPKILTNGANDTASLSVLVVRASIDNLRPGYGSALSTLTFLFIFVVAFVFVKVLGTNVVSTQQRGVK
jgi:ABC-type sugar transport system permease subunit